MSFSSGFDSDSKEELAALLPVPDTAPSIMSNAAAYIMDDKEAGALLSDEVSGSDLPGRTLSGMPTIAVSQGIERKKHDCDKFPNPAPVDGHYGLLRTLDNPRSEGSQLFNYSLTSETFSAMNFFENDLDSGVETSRMVGMGLCILVVSLAMFGQAGFAGLLVFQKLIGDVAETSTGWLAFAGALALAEAFATWFGKDAIVMKFTKDAWMEAAASVSRERSLMPLLPTVRHLPWPTLGLKLLNMAAGMNASLMFTYLSVLGCDGVATQLSALGATGLAGFVASPYLKAVLGACAFISNVGFDEKSSGFAGIHRAGVSLYLKEAERLFASTHATQEHLRIEGRINVVLNALINQVNALSSTSSDEEFREIADILKGVIEKGVKDKTSHFYETLLATLASEVRPYAQIAYMLQYLKKYSDSVDLRTGFAEYGDPQPVIGLEYSVAAERFRAFGSFCAAALCAYGLSNFFDVSKGLDHWLGIQNEIAATICSVLGVTSMAMMSAFTMGMGDFCAAKFAGWTGAHVLERRGKAEPNECGTRVFRETSVASMCAAGGGPNVYQSLVLYKQPYVAVGAAGAASFMLEVHAGQEITRDWRLNSAAQAQAKKLKKLKERPQLSYYMSDSESQPLLDPDVSEEKKMIKIALLTFIAQKLEEAPFGKMPVGRVEFSRSNNAFCFRGEALQEPHSAFSATGNPSPPPSLPETAGTFGGLNSL